MSYAILRTAKLKSANNIKGASRHNARTQNVLNADMTKKNETLVDGGSDVYTAVMQKIKNSNARFRKNSVLAQEIFLSVSPEYFRPDSPARAGHWDQKKLEKWKSATVEFLQEKFADNIIDCRLHLDESTPHIHAIVTPLIREKEKTRLSARDMFNKKTLRDMQTSYAQSLQHLNIQRGIEHSKAKHTDIKAYYNAVNTVEKRNIPRIKTPSLMIKKETRKKYQKTINTQLKKRLITTFQKAKHVDISAKKQNEYKYTAESANARYNEIKAQMKAAAEKARAVDLALVLEKAGLDRDVKDKNQFVGGGHRITIKDQKFFDHNNNSGGGGAIDLVMHLQQFSFKEAVAWLGQNIDIDAAARAIKDQAVETAKTCTNDIDVTFRIPIDYSEKIPELKKYLADVRGLDPAITNPLIDDPLNSSIYATVYNNYVNAVFLCRNSKTITGAEIKGISGQYSGMAKGSRRKDGAFTVGDPSTKKAVFVESAIDAISYYQMHKGCFVISTAGATTAPPFVKTLQKQGFELVVAYDNDKTGQAFNAKFLEQYPDASTDISYKKDWNDDLRYRQSLEVEMSQLVEDTKTAAAENIDVRNEKCNFEFENEDQFDCMQDSIANLHAKKMTLEEMIKDFKQNTYDLLHNETDQLAESDSIDVHYENELEL